MANFQQQDLKPGQMTLTTFVKKAELSEDSYNKEACDDSDAFICNFVNEEVRDHIATSQEEEYVCHICGALIANTASARQEHEDFHFAEALQKNDNAFQRPPTGKQHSSKSRQSSLRLYFK